MVFDPEALKVIRDEKVSEKEVWCVDFAPNGKEYLTTDQNDVKIWNLDSGTLVQTLEGHDKIVTGARFTSDGEYLVSCAQDNRVHIFQRETPMAGFDFNLKKKIDAHTKLVDAIDVSNDGKRIVSAAHDNTIKIWDLKGNLLRAIDPAHQAAIWWVRFVGYLANQICSSGARDNKLKLWDADSGALIRELEGHSSGITNFDVSPDGNHIVSGDSKKLKIWEFDSGQNIQELDMEDTITIRFEPGGDYVLVGTKKQTRVLRFNFGASEVVKTLDDEFVFTFAFSPDGRYMLTGQNDGKAHLYDLGTSSYTPTSTTTTEEFTFKPGDRVPGTVKKPEPLEL